MPQPPRHPARYAEDYAPGQVFDLGTRTLSREEILAFAEIYDPQPFHLDEAAAKATMFGGLIASGWQTALVLMRMMIDGGFLTPETGIGSPGHDELRWLRPVRPGDALQGRVVVDEVRISRSRPEVGLVRHTGTLANPAGEEVYRVRSVVLVRTRQGAAAAAAAGNGGTVPGGAG